MELERLHVGSHAERSDGEKLTRNNSFKRKTLSLEARSTSTTVVQENELVEDRDFKKQHNKKETHSKACTIL
jgi:hypothetical protein